MELFHLIADGASARVRRRLTELGLTGGVSFRNLHYETHREAFAAAGGRTLPALSCEGVLHEGEEACLALLEERAKGAR